MLHDFILFHLNVNVKLKLMIIFVRKYIFENIWNIMVLGWINLNLYKFSFATDVTI